MQLHLLKSKKQKGKAPPPLEFASHVFIADTLRQCCSKEWEWTHFPAGEKRNIVTAARLKRMGLRPGWLDFQFAGPNRQMLFLELKRRGSKPSDAQEHLIAHLLKCGFDVQITDNVREAIAWLKGYGILRVEVQ